MKRSLFVQYADGHEDVYPFAAGQSTLGSDSDCEYGIQAAGVAGRHVAFSDGDGGTFVVNLQDSGTVRLNGVPLDGRHPFEIGDELEVGSVRVRLQPVATEGDNLADSPDGVNEVAESARRADHYGWRGYRKMLESVAPFISPAEAEKAECLHRSGHRALVECLLVLLAIMAAAWLLEAHRRFLTAEICRCTGFYLELIFVLILTIRYRIRCAGRLFALLGVLDLWQMPPERTWVDYFGGVGTGSLTTCVLLPLAYLYGWGVDVGAGCLFRQRRSRSVWRYLLLLASVGLACGGYFLLEKQPGCESPIAAVCYLPLLAVAGIFPLWGRLVPRKWADGELDVAFVAEQASRRLWRRWRARLIAFLAVGTPLLYLLISLGTGERVICKKSDPLVVSTGKDGEKLAWYWIDRGRYLEKNDFNTESIYQVPFDILLAGGADIPGDGEIPGEKASAPEMDSVSPDLEDKVTEIRDVVWDRSGPIRANRAFVRNGIDPDDADAVAAFLETDAGKRENDAFAGENADLSAWGEELCRKIANVQLDATNAAAFAELRMALAPYRSHPTEDDHALGKNMRRTDSMVFYLEETANRETYTSGPHPNLHHAQPLLGVWTLSQADARKWVAQIEALVIPVLVLLVLGGLLLWKRGADSPVGFWLGIGMAMNALAVFDAVGIPGEDCFGKMLQYPLWHWACQSPLGGLVAGWFATLRTFGSVFTYAAWLSQSVIFVLVCWPRSSVAHWGRLRRLFVFLGKVLVVLGIGAVAALLSGVAMDGVSVEEEIGEWVSILVPRFAAIAVLGILGAWMRHKRRFDTETPELGWMFFGSWLFLELAVLFVMEAEIDPLVPESWVEPLAGIPGSLTLVGLVSWIAAAIGGFLFLRLCLKRNFLCLLTPNGFTFALFSFSVPIVAAVCNPLVGRLFEDSFLQSVRGERIVGIAVVVLVLRPLWNVLDKLSRRLSVRNLVRVEAGVNATLETVLDMAEEMDFRDEIFKRLDELGVDSYAFFARSSADSFKLVLQNGWSVAGADSFRMSPYLRQRLGADPHVVDLNRLAQEESFFFHSFELFRIGQRIHAACLLPICLGKSVRAVLATPDVRDGRSLPNADAFLENVNTLGLVTVESLQRTSGHEAN